MAFRLVGLGGAEAAGARGRGLGVGRKQALAGVAFSLGLAAGGPRWSERGRTADQRLQALMMADDSQACVAAAEALLPTLEQGSSFARVAGAGLSCALGLEDELAKLAAVKSLEPQARRALGQKGVLSDDKLGLYDALHGARKVQGDEPGARRVAREWLAFIEDQSKKAKDPLGRSALDGSRLSAAMALGEPERALPALRASAAALPGEYFAQSYVAVCALEAGKPEEALEAARRAAPLAEGPRKVRIMTVEAQALKALGRDEEARGVLAAAVAHGEALPEAVRPKGHIGRAKKLLGQWTPEATPAPTPAPAPASTPAVADPPLPTGERAGVRGTAPPPAEPVPALK